MDQLVQNFSKFNFEVGQSRQSEGQTYENEALAQGNNLTVVHVAGYSAIDT